MSRGMAAVEIDLLLLLTTTLPLLHFTQVLFPITTHQLSQKPTNPAPYTTTTSNPLPNDLEEEQEQDSTPETKVLNQLATFDKITVYGHEVQPDAQEDAYVKGINEWIGLAGAVSFPSLRKIRCLKERY